MNADLHVVENTDNQLLNEIEKICAIRGEHPTTGLRDLREMPYGEPETPDRNNQLIEINVRFLSVPALLLLLDE